jgi:hypothetical protein
MLHRLINAVRKDMESYGDKMSTYERDLIELNAEKTDDVGYFAPDPTSDAHVRTVRGTTSYINVYAFLNQLKALVPLKSEEVVHANLPSCYAKQLHGGTPLSCQTKSPKEDILVLSYYNEEHRVLSDLLRKLGTQRSVLKVWTPHRVPKAL